MFLITVSLWDVIKEVIFTQGPQPTSSKSPLFETNEFIFKESQHQVSGSLPHKSSHRVQLAHHPKWNISRTRFPAQYNTQDQLVGWTVLTSRFWRETWWMESFVAPRNKVPRYYFFFTTSLIYVRFFFNTRASAADDDILEKAAASGFWRCLIVNQRDGQMLYVCFWTISIRISE